MVNLNNPTVIAAAVATVVILLFLVWLLTRRTSVVPDPVPTDLPTTTGAPKTGDVPVLADQGTLQVGALPDVRPTIDLLDTRQGKVEPIAVKPEMVTDGASPSTSDIPAVVELSPSSLVSEAPIGVTEILIPEAASTPQVEETEPVEPIPADAAAPVEEEVAPEAEVLEAYEEAAEEEADVAPEAAITQEDVPVAEPEPVAEEPEGEEAPEAAVVEEPEAEEPREEELLEEEAEAEPEAEAGEEAPKLSLFERFSARLTRTRNQLGAQLRSIFGGGLDDDVWEELEDSLISADVGVEATTDLVEQLRTNVRDKGITKGDAAMVELKAILLDDLTIGNRDMKRRESGTSVWLFTGVNGTGKTTSIGKLTKRYTDEGDHVVLAAADTFRAAAADQLKIWGERSGVRVIAQEEGADPAAVAFDGYKAAAAAGADLLLIDTAGRLQNKTELMAELEKIKRVVEREAGPIDEALLVLDATTGQNGLTQAKAFAEAVNLTGVVLTKLDGTAKGGVVIAIQRTLGIPVKWVGLGEGIEDLSPFDPEVFIDALFSEES